MDYLVHRPGPPLANHVEYLWLIRDVPRHSLERIVPSGTLELVINLEDDEVRICDDEGRVARQLDGAVVSGVYRRYFVIDTRAHAAMIGAHFRPGCAAAVLGIPPGELADLHVELVDLWSAEARALRERLGEARDPAEAFAELEAALCARLARSGDPTHAAVPHALALVARGANIGEIAATVGLSRRRLIEVFTASVGVTPKRMGRLLRLQRALASAQRGSDWTSAALASGYYDQAHLIRDCNELAGMPPSTLVSASTDVKPHHARAR